MAAAALFLAARKLDAGLLTAAVCGTTPRPHSAATSPSPTSRPRGPSTPSSLAWSVLTANLFIFVMSIKFQTGQSATLVVGSLSLAEGNMKVREHPSDPVFVKKWSRNVELRIGSPNPGETRYAMVNRREARQIAIALLTAAEELEPPDVQAGSR